MNRLSSAIDFQDRVAVVTGAAKGIGRETAIALAGAGAAVAVWDRAEDEARAVVETIQAGDRGSASFFAVDVADRPAVDAAAAGTAERFGRIDILINNAGILRHAQLVKVEDGKIVGQMSEQDFDDVLAVNVKGVFNCTQAVVPFMIERNYGRIISASSVVGLHGNFGQTNYVATTAGVIGLTQVWARALGKYGIPANAIAPGFIETDMALSVPNKILRGMIGQTPVGRLGQPRDVANAYLFLASEQASFINGAVLSVDGGLVTGS